MVSNPVTNHSTNNHPAEPRSRAIAEVTIKIPEPIMEPATILVASINPNERFNSCLVSDIVYFWWLDFKYN